MTKAAVERFEAMIEQLREEPSTLPLEVQSARIEAAGSHLRDLSEQMAEYTALRASSGAVLELASLDQLPDALIAARIARGLTQRELAELLGVAEQQVQRDEKSRY